MQSIEELLRIQAEEKAAIKNRLGAEVIDGLILKRDPVDRRIFNRDTGEEILVDDPFFDGHNFLTK